MHAKQSLALAALLLLTSTSWAKEAQPETKPESVTIPYEEIVIDGKKMPLTIDTLANLQRYSQESDLYKKVQKALDQGKPAVAAQKPAIATQKPQAELQGKAQAQTSDKPKEPAFKAPARHTVLSVFGTPGQMTAEVYIDRTNIRQLRVGDYYQGYRVASIDLEGLQAVRRGSSIWVGVGQRVFGQRK